MHRVSHFSMLIVALMTTSVSGSPVERQDVHRAVLLVGGSHKRSAREAKVRADLHRNLDGKGGGFVVRWSFNKSRFTLVVDRSRYENNKFYATAMTARAIFDSNGFPLPKIFVVEDENGQELGRGPFANVPALVQ